MYLISVTCIGSHEFNCMFAPIINYLKPNHNMAKHVKNLILNHVECVYIELLDQNSEEINIVLTVIGKHGLVLSVGVLNLAWLQRYHHSG